MSERKFPPEVYKAYKDAGLTNYEIADILQVDESTVRRGLRRPLPPEHRDEAKEAIRRLVGHA